MPVVDLLVYSLLVPKPIDVVRAFGFFAESPHILGVLLPGM